MDKSSQDEFNDLLQHFDNHVKKTKHSRRASVSYLWDAYMKLLFVVGVKLCDLYEESLDSVHLARRWRQIRKPLSVIGNPDDWNYLITKLDGVRNRVNHNSEFVPKLDELNQIREKAPDFKKWIIKTGKDFFKKNKNLTLNEKFYSEYEWAIREAEVHLNTFGDNPYISFEFDTRWDEMKNLKNTMKERLIKTDRIKEIQKDDLSYLLNLKELISIFSGREDMVLHLNRCPKCGEKIINTTQYFGGTRDDPEPDGFHYRVGCEKCDYFLDDGTEYL